MNQTITKLEPFVPRPANKAAMRTHYVPKIEKLLAAGPTSREAITKELGLNHNTVTGYLRYMHQDLRIIRKAERLPDNTVLWEMGEDLTLSSADADVAQHTVPAQQVGMWRDGLVAALFGAPQGVAA